VLTRFQCPRSTNEDNERPDRLSRRTLFTTGVEQKTIRNPPVKWRRGGRGR